MLVAELPEPRRRWRAWMILEPDEKFYRLSMQDPSTVHELAMLLSMGWLAIPVEIIETNEY